MHSFEQKIKELFSREKGMDIDQMDYIDLPDERASYNSDRSMGSVNLSEGRFIIPKEAEAEVDAYLSVPWPSMPQKNI